ncbi:MAG: nickel-dependent lactate racemase, partial [Cyanobacteria bacterium P01_H01_bin.121]
MQVKLRCGHGYRPVDVPETTEATLIHKPQMPVLTDLHEAFLNAFQDPIQAQTLHAAAQQAQSACIAICDITRPVPNGLFLRLLIETLLTAGIAASNITVLIATGLHRPNLGQELLEVVGDSWVLDNVRVENHNARDDAQHVYIGTTKRGTVVRLNQHFVNADLRIVTGLVSPHFMAGYSGGRKVVAPGLAHAETITTLHNGQFMADPGAANCRLSDNPLHHEQLEVIAMLGRVLALNIVVDTSRHLSFVNFGEVVSSHLQAVDVARQYYEVSAPRRFSTILTSAGGYPLDQTYYQTIKGIVGAIDILEPGGDLLIVSACSDGLGSPA